MLQQKEISHATKPYIHTPHARDMARSRIHRQHIMLFSSLFFPVRPWIRNLFFLPDVLWHIYSHVFTSICFASLYRRAYAYNTNKKSVWVAAHVEALWHISCLLRGQKLYAKVFREKLKIYFCSFFPGFLDDVVYSIDENERWEKYLRRTGRWLCVQHAKNANVVWAVMNF